MKAFIIFIFLLIPFLLSEAFADIHGDRFVIDRLQLDAKLYRKIPEKIDFILSKDQKIAYLQLGDRLLKTRFHLKLAYEDHCNIKIYISDIKLKKSRSSYGIHDYSQVQIQDSSEAVCDHQESYDVRIDLVQTRVNTKTSKIKAYTSSLFFKRHYYSALDPVIPLQ